METNHGLNGERGIQPGDLGHHLAITGIPSADVVKWWPIVEKLVSSALEYDEVTDADDVFQRLLLGHMQLWVVLDERKDLSVSITEITGDICRILILAGSGVSDWLGQFLEIIERWAAAHDCIVVETIGREGWRKYGKKYGYDYAYTVLRKKIEE